MTAPTLLLPRVHIRPHSCRQSAQKVFRILLFGPNSHKEKHAEFDPAAPSSHEQNFSLQRIPLNTESTHPKQTHSSRQIDERFEKTVHGPGPTGSPSSGQPVAQLHALEACLVMFPRPRFFLLLSFH